MRFGLYNDLRWPADVQVVAENGLLCGPYESGEIWISGPQVMKVTGRRHSRQKKPTIVMDLCGPVTLCITTKMDSYLFVIELIKVNGKQ
ncbi:hypothetical protein GCK32_015107, partial [Trichostrongylus colubriformis]